MTRPGTTGTTLVVGVLVTAVLSALAEGTSRAPQLAGLTMVASGTVLVPVSWRRTPGQVPVT
jgi:hypothetical protein